MLGFLYGLLAQIPKFKVEKKGLPGADVANGFVNGLGFYALLAAIAGMLISGGIWAVGAHSNNFNQSFNGKKGLLVAAGAALIIGAANFLVEFFFGQGGQVKAAAGLLSNFI